VVRGVCRETGRRAHTPEPPYGGSPGPVRTQGRDGIVVRERGGDDEINKKRGERELGNEERERFRLRVN